MKLKVFMVKDAFGKPLGPGDEIAWIRQPSKTWTYLGKGILCSVEDHHGRPQLVVKPSDKHDPVCRLKTWEYVGRNCDFRFPRVVKL